MRFLVATALLVLVQTMSAQSVSALIARGDKEDKANRNSSALEIYLLADKQQPDDPDILYRISKQQAQLMLDAKSTAQKKAIGAKALDAATRAVKFGPDNSQAHLALAVVYGRLALLESPGKQIEMSRLIHDEAATAVRLDPKNDIAWYVLGRWNYELANLNPILKALAQTIYGKFPDASNENALAAFRKAAAIDPKSVMHQIELGRTLAILGKNDEARKAIETGLALPSRAMDDEETKQRGRDTLEKLK